MSHVDRAKPCMFSSTKCVSGILRAPGPVASCNQSTRILEILAGRIRLMIHGHEIHVGQKGSTQFCRKTIANHKSKSRVQAHGNQEICSKLQLNCFQKLFLLSLRPPPG